MDKLLNLLIQRGSPFELQNVVINGVPCKIFPKGPKTLQDVFIKAESFMDRDFVTCGDERMSFRKAIAHANILANDFKKKYGVSKGGRVAIIMENNIEWIISFIAIYLADAVGIVIHANAKKKVIINAIEIVDCDLIITDPRTVKKIGVEISQKPIVFICNERLKDKIIDTMRVKKVIQNSFISILSEKEQDLNSLQIREYTESEPDDEALIAFTSGTTGTPKGVVFSHRNLMTGMMNMMLGGYIMSSSYKKKRGERKIIKTNMPPCTLLISPLSYIGGYAQIMLMCYLGGKIVLMNEWDVNKAYLLIETEKVRSLSGASQENIREILRGNRLNYNLETLTNINIHGLSLKRNFIIETEKILPEINISTGYGLTETCGTISVVSGKELLNNPQTSGKLLPSVDIKIIDDNENELLKGQIGEICIRGAMVTKGYCTETKNSDELFKEGWLKTGDIGRIDSDEKLYITNREKEIIFYNQKSFLIRELESIIISHHMIDEAVFLGLPEAQCCKSIVLAIMPKNIQQLDEKKLKAEILSRLKKIQIVPEVVIFKSFPRTISGKVDRKEIMRKLKKK